MKINYNDINTLHDLQAQIRMLKDDYEQKGVMLKEDAKNYVKQFTPGNLIKRFATPGNFLKLDEKTNIISKITSIVLPLLLNKTIFRGSGMITKALAALVSGKVGQQLDGQHLSGIVNTVKSWFSKKAKKDNIAFVDYGIPPDSETY